MSINYQQLKKAVFAYIAIPVVLFLIFYCGSVISIVVGIAAMSAYFFSVSKKQNSPFEDSVFIPKKVLFCIGLIILFWCFFGGQGGLYYQSPDWNMRNTLLRDLINFDWPVIYEQYDKALVYYISYWMPSALIGKLALLICANLNIAFFVGNIALLCWTAAGMFLVILLFTSIIKPKTNKGLLFLPAFLILFSGMDIVGVIAKILLKNQTFADLHLEWWANHLQFSSVTTCLFWVFNQAVIPWLITLCIFKEKDARNYVFLGVCAFASAPIPFLGIFVYLIGSGIVYFYRAVKTKNIKTFLVSIFTPQNILSLLVIVPFAFYYLANNALSSGNSAASQGGISLWFLTLKPFSLGGIVRYFIFIMLEAGIYLLLVNKENRKNHLYLMTWLSLIISPLFTVGTADDFVMRFSVPAIMATAVFTAKFLFENAHKRSNNEPIKSSARKVCAILCACLVLGCVTPLTEFVRGYVNVLVAGKINVVYDEFKTLNQASTKNDPNFVTYNYDDSLFFKYFSRK